MVMKSLVSSYLKLWLEKRILWVVPEWVFFHAAHTQLSYNNTCYIFPWASSSNLFALLILLQHMDKSWELCFSKEVLIKNFWPVQMLELLIRSCWWWFLHCLSQYKHNAKFKLIKHFTFQLSWIPYHISKTSREVRENRGLTLKQTQ